MDQVYKQAREIEKRARAYADEQGSREVQGLFNEARDLCEAIEMKKSPDHLEDRVEKLMGRLEAALKAGSMTHSEGDDLEDRCRDLQQMLRKM